MYNSYGYAVKAAAHWSVDVAMWNGHNVTIRVIAHNESEARNKALDTAQARALHYMCIASVTKTA